MKQYDEEKMMTTDRDDEEIMIIKRKIMNAFKRTDEKIDDMKKLLRRDDAKLKRVFKSVFDLRFRNSDSQFTFTDITTLNSVDDLVTSSVHLTSSITFSSTKNKTSVKNSIIKNVKSKTSLKFKCLKNDEFFDWHNWCNATDIILSLF